MYVYFGDLKPITGIFYGVSPAVIALIVHSCWRYYFAFFFVILPLLGLFEKTKPLPNSISESVLHQGIPVGASAPPSFRAPGEERLK
jgi:hypothetical protein